jgi:hypothetical protein
VPPTTITGDGMISLFYTGPEDRLCQERDLRHEPHHPRLGPQAEGRQGNYLWMPGIAGNVPNTILGAPYAEMPDMPNEGAGLFPIAVGDWQRAYRVVDRVLISVLRDPFTQSGSVRSSSARASASAAASRSARRSPS